MGLINALRRVHQSRTLIGVSLDLGLGYSLPGVVSEPLERQRVLAGRLGNHIIQMTCPDLSDQF